MATLFIFKGRFDEVIDKRLIPKLTERVLFYVWKEDDGSVGLEHSELGIKFID